MLKHSGNPARAGRYLLSAVMVWGAMTLSVQAKSPTLHSKNFVGPAKGGTSAKQSKGIPHEINYQGWLGDASDTTGVTGDFNMVFGLYDDSTAGSVLWNETQSAVTVDKGVFHVLLGSQTPIPTGIFTGAPLWLETQVESDTLSPRKKLVSVGYAIRSVYADTAGYASSSAPDNDWTVSGSNLYAQDTSWNVGIGTENPPTHSRLYVAANGAFYGVYGLGSDGKEAGVFGLANMANYGVLGLGSVGKTAGVSGEANGANYGVYGLGFTGKTAGVYGFANNANYGVYGRGSTGKQAAVYGVANGANYAGYFNGDVHITGAVTMNTVTRYYSVPAGQFSAYRDTYQYFRGSSNLYTSTAGQTHWFAGVNLPDSAVVTSITGYVYDTDGSEDIDLRLNRVSHSGGVYQMANVSSSGSGGNQEISAVPSASTIDNELYAYQVQVTLKAGSNVHSLYQVKITYKITQPLP